MKLQNYTKVFQVFMDFGAEAAVKLLKDELAIECKPFHVGAGSHYYMCNYNQIDSPKSHPLVMQCRSLIVDGFGEVVSAKYERFFNIGECPEIVGKINIRNSTIFEKDDGSLIGIWFNFISGRWEISTRSMPMGEGPFELPDGTQIPFADMVIATMLNIDPKTVDDLARERFQEEMFAVDEYLKDSSNTNDKPWNGILQGVNEHSDICGANHTLVFEWVHPLNRIVTPYAEPAMVLVTATVVNGHDSIECSKTRVDEICDAMHLYFENVRRVVSFNSNNMTLEEIEGVVSRLPDLKEGFVIQCNETGIRAKIKSKTYVTAHRLRGEFSVPRDKDLCALVKQNEEDEFLAYFPEWKERVDSIKFKSLDYVVDISLMYAKIENIENQKDFALAVQSLVADKKIGSIGSAMMFQRRKGVALKKYIDNMTENKFYDFYTEAARFTQA